MHKNRPAARSFDFRSVKIIDLDVYLYWLSVGLFWWLSHYSFVVITHFCVFVLSVFAIFLTDSRLFLFLSCSSCRVRSECVSE